MLKISFTNLTHSADVEAYFEEEAENGRPDKSESMERYYGHAVPAQWLRVTEHGVTVSAVQKGDIANGLRGYGQNGEEIASNAGKEGRKAGTDIGMGLDKTLSSLRRAAELADEQELVAGIDAAFEKAHAEVWETIGRLQLVDARAGAQGTTSRPAVQLNVINITHDISRSGDPQTHKHSLLLNACTRDDGKPATIEAGRLVAHKFMLEAVGSSVLARELRALGLGIEEVGKEGRGRLQVAGIPEAVVEAWSKRRATLEQARDAKDRMGIAIENIAAEQAEADAKTDSVTGRPLSRAEATKARRERMQDLAQQTRSRKDELPDTEALEQRHRAELAAAGTSPEGLIESVRQAQLRVPTPDRDVQAFALERLFEGESVATQRQIRTAVAEAAAIHGWSARQITETADTLAAGMERLGTNAKGETVYTTREAMETERALLRAAYDAKSKGVLRRESVEAAIQALASRPDNPIRLADEQKAALLHAANGDALAVVRGVAGAGKTTAMEALTDAAHRQRMHVYALAPTNRAATGLHAEAKTDERMSIQKMRMLIEEQGGRNLRMDRNTLIIIDEAGMAEMRDASIVATYARERGATVLFLGDELQFAPVGAGAPLRLLKDQIGASELKEIRRQKVDWQREASLKMADGESVAGLEDYDAHGRIHVAKDQGHGMDQLVRDYKTDLRTNPTASRIVITTSNADSHDLNERLRKVQEDEGRLTGPEVTIPAYRRDGGDGELADLRLRAGDQVIAWKNHKDLAINNGDRFTVVSVGMDTDTREAVLELRRENGRTFTARASDLIPPAGNEDGNRQPAPFLQHAYAVTTYSSQGATLDRSFIWGGAGMDRATTYVALTRHRQDAQVYFDGEAARTELVERGEEPTRDAIRAHLIGAASESRDKLCVSDFVGNVRHWAFTGEMTAPAESRAERLMEAAEQDERRLTEQQLGLRPADAAEPTPTPKPGLVSGQTLATLREANGTVLAVGEAEIIRQTEGDPQARAARLATHGENERRIAANGLLPPDRLRELGQPVPDDVTADAANKAAGWIRKSADHYGAKITADMHSALVDGDLTKANLLAERANQLDAARDRYTAAATIAQDAASSGSRGGGIAAPANTSRQDAARNAVKAQDITPAERPGEALRQAAAARRVEARANKPLPSREDSARQEAEKSARKAHVDFLASQREAEQRRIQEAEARRADPTLKKAHERTCDRERRRVEAHNERLTRAMRDEIARATRPGIVRGVAWEIQRTPLKMKQELRRKVYGLVPFGSTYADRLSRQENHDWYNRKYEELRKEREPLIKQIEEKYKPHFERYKEPDFPGVADDHAKGRAKYPYGPDAQILAPRERMQGDLPAHLTPQDIMALRQIGGEAAVEAMRKPGLTDANSRETAVMSVRDYLHTLQRERAAEEQRMVLGMASAWNVSEKQARDHLNAALEQRVDPRQIENKQLRDALSRLYSLEKQEERVENAMRFGYLKPSHEIRAVDPHGRTAEGNEAVVREAEQRRREYTEKPKPWQKSDPRYDGRARPAGEVLRYMEIQRKALGDSYEPGQAPAKTTAWHLDRAIGDLREGIRTKAIDARKDSIELVAPDSGLAWAKAKQDAFASASERKSMDTRHTGAFRNQAAEAGQESSAELRSVTDRGARPNPTPPVETLKHQKLPARKAPVLVHVPVR